MLAVTGSKHGYSFFNLAFDFFFSISFLLLELMFGLDIRVRVSIRCISATNSLSSSCKRMASRTFTKGKIVSASLTSNLILTLQQP